MRADDAAQSMPLGNLAASNAGACTTKHDGPPGNGGVGQDLAHPDRPAVDSIEQALGRAIALASEAGEWSVVVELGRELAERRRARTAPGVASLDTERAKRDGKR